MKKKYRAELEVVSGPKDGELFTIDGKKFSLGRSDMNDLCLPYDLKVEEKDHLQFWFSDDDKWKVKNASDRTVLVDGAELKTTSELHVSQVIKVGNTELMVTLLEPGAKGKVEALDGNDEGGTHRRVKICPGKECRAENDISETYCKKCGRRLD